MSDTDPTRVERWMSADLIVESPDTVLFDALEQMEHHRIRHLPVTDDKGHLLGILSSRDAARATRGKTGEDPLQKLTVKEVMTGGRLHCVEPSTLVREAAETICREKVSALPVKQGEKLVGIVTSEDLLWALLEVTAEE